MPRIKRGVTTRAKHKRILDNAKGYYGRRKNTIRIARQAVEKAGQYAYRDRKVKKRSFRALWIQRINAAVRAAGLTYGQFIHALKLANIDLDRKVLADIAMHEAEAFSAISAQAKAALPKAASTFRETRKGVGAIRRPVFCRRKSGGGKRRTLLRGLVRVHLNRRRVARATGPRRILPRTTNGHRRVKTEGFGLADNTV